MAPTSDPTIPPLSLDSSLLFSDEIKTLPPVMFTPSSVPAVSTPPKGKTGRLLKGKTPTATTMNVINKDIEKYISPVISTTHTSKGFVPMNPANKPSKLQNSATKANTLRQQFLKKKINQRSGAGVGGVLPEKAQPKMMMPTGTKSMFHEAGETQGWVKQRPQSNGGMPASALKYDVTALDTRDRALDATAPDQATSFMTYARRTGRGLDSTYQGSILEGGMSENVKSVDLGGTVDFEGASSHQQSQIQPQGSKFTTNTANTTNTLQGTASTGTGTGGKKNDLNGEIQQIRGYLDLLDQYSLHNFIIHKGVALRNTPEFMSFQRKYNNFWGSIETILGSLEEFFTLFEVPLAVVDGQKVAELAACDKDNVTRDDLLSCVSNLEQVLPILKSKAKAGQVFQVGSRSHLRKSVVKLQSWMRMLIAVRDFITKRNQKRASTRIQMTWRRVLAKCRVRILLKAKREKDAVRWEQLKNQLKDNFSLYHDPESHTSHTIIHLPSLSIDEYIRLGMDHYTAQQNLQMSRLADLCRNPNTEIIYVSPFPLDDEIVDYMKKILDVGGYNNATSRFTILVPELLDSFPQHFPLASLLLYSPRTMHRIKQLMRGKRGYIVPNFCGYWEKILSLELNVPTLAPEVGVFDLLSTRSGAKRAFMNADVSVPVGAHDIYDEEDFIIALTKLIASNLDVSRWLMKMDVDFNGAGTAYFDVAHMRSVGELRREREQLFKIHHGDVTSWQTPDVQLLARAKLLKDLRVTIFARARCCSRGIYTNFKQFLMRFLRVGGVIEAAPIDIVGRPTVNLLIEPSGKVIVHSCCELLTDKDEITIGSVYPMTCVPAKALKAAATAVAEGLQQKNVIGYLSINFVAFNLNSGGGGESKNYQEKASRKLRMWGVSISPRLTNAASQYHLVNSICKSSSEGEGPESPLMKSYAALDYLYCPSLTRIQYGSFFKLCRMNSISFDIDSLNGLMFLLFDSLAGGMLGMLAVGDCTAEAMTKLADGFNFIKGNIGNAKNYQDVDEFSGNYTFVQWLKFIQAEAKRRTKLQDARDKALAAKRARN